jgi:hypothetical protein
MSLDKTGCFGKIHKNKDGCLENRAIRGREPATRPHESGMKEQQGNPSSKVAVKRRSGTTAVAMATGLHTAKPLSLATNGLESSQDDVFL